MVISGADFCFFDPITYGEGQLRFLGLPLVIRYRPVNGCIVYEHTDLGLRLQFSSSEDFRDTFYTAISAKISDLWNTPEGRKNLERYLTYIPIHNCPLCGCQAQESIKDNSFIISCSDCGVSLSMPFTTSRYWADLVASCRKAWNRRSKIK